MALHTTELSFELPESYNCKTLLILDSSIYNSSMTITGAVLQVLVPGYKNVVELSYYKNGVTTLNSNLLKITNVVSSNDYLNLPDGAYTAKISICPYDDFWFEKTWYRTCVLECKYSQAILKLDLNSCTECYSTDFAQKLNTAKMYIEGVKANMNDCNIKKATELYNVANRILDEIVNCDCNKSINNKFVSSSLPTGNNISSPRCCP